MDFVEGVDDRMKDGRKERKERKKEKRKKKSRVSSEVRWAGLSFIDVSFTFVSRLTEREKKKNNAFVATPQFFLTAHEHKLELHGLSFCFILFVQHEPTAYCLREKKTSGATT